MLLAGVTAVRMIPLLCGRGEKRPWPISRYYISSGLEKLRKTTIPHACIGCNPVSLCAQLIVAIGRVKLRTMSLKHGRALFNLNINQKKSRAIKRRYFRPVTLQFTHTPPIAYSCNRPWRPIGLWDVEYPSFSTKIGSEIVWHCPLPEAYSYLIYMTFREYVLLPF
jgi:hypothetical protein